MTWTYNLAALSTTPLFQVRFLVGDTDTLDQQMQDEELNFALQLRPSIWGASAMCCAALASNLSRQADVVDKDLRSTYSQRAAAYARRAQQYEAQAQARSGSLPYGGGLTYSDKFTQQNNPDLVKPQFNLGMTDNYIPVAPAGNEVISGNNDTIDPAV
jgi:hypothetical protein